MLKKGNVYQYKNKLWVYAGMSFDSSHLGTFSKYTFYLANKDELTQRDVSHFKRDVYKFMKHDATATILYGRQENDSQLTDILTGKFFQNKQNRDPFGIMYASNLKYDIKHIATIFKKGLDVHGYHDVVVVWDSMCAITAKSK